MRATTLAAVLFLTPNCLPAAEILPFSVKLDVALKELHEDFCWFHPRTTAIPGHGQNGNPAVLLTLQKHLKVSDHYSGLYWMWSDDLGKTWTKPEGPPELDWQKESDQVDIAVADVTPGWHPATGKVIAIGIKVRYSKAGAELLDKPRSWECAYAVFEPATKKWTRWQMLSLPETEGKFYIVGPGCCQWLVQPDGALLIPCYIRGPKVEPYRTTVLHCSFDGKEMKFLGHGDEIKLAEGRGIYEPSMCRFQGKVYLTLRSDARGYVAVSDDGLHYQPIKAWVFDDGKELGSHNTQQHWVPHSDGLFLSYTRRGANNDHIPRNRAPIFIAQVDPKSMQVLRKTEKVLMPERGAMLGNFGSSPITPNESWVTDAEFILGKKPHAKGADGSIFVARVLWEKPNQDVPKK